MRPAPAPASGIAAPEQLTETEFQRLVVQTAGVFGWGVAYRSKRGQAEPDEPLDGLIFHPRIMYRSEPGWPDLTLIRRRDRRLLFAELKTEKGKLTKRQERVLDLLEEIAGPIGGDPPASRIDVRVWRPSDWDEIVAVLR